LADIFISYTSSDRDWAFWIAKELEALGHTPHIHEWEIKGGDDIYAWMEQRHDAANHVMCVVSDEYLKAPYSTLERNAALWQAAGKRPGFVLLVAVKPCKLPTLADHIRRCELYGISQETARIRFREFVSRRDTPALIAFPGEQFAVSNIPIPVPEHFLGRDDSLVSIEAALSRYEGRVAITTLHGLRGVGKTTLAAAYAERHRGDYRATWWIRAETEPTMRADLVALGIRLKWVAPDDKEDSAFAGVMDRLRNEGAGILLIYDNALDAEALRPNLPPGGAARVLVTSNAHAWRGIAEPVEIRLWPKEIGADFLIARTGREDERTAAEALSDVLGGLPLAHEQAAAYCERLEISLADYHKRFEAAPVPLLDDTGDALREYHDRRTVAKTFALAINQAAKLHPAAELLIVHAARLAPEPIPLFLLLKLYENAFYAPRRSWSIAIITSWLLRPIYKQRVPVQIDAKIEFENAVAALRTFALADHNTITDEHNNSIKTDCIRVHRLVRQIAIARRSDDALKDIDRTQIDSMAAVFPGTGSNDLENWRVRRLDAIAFALVASDSALVPGSERHAADLLIRLAYYRQLGLVPGYDQARPLYERALAIRQKVLGSSHLDTLQSLESLAKLLLEQGDLAGAQPLYEQMQSFLMGAKVGSMFIAAIGVGSKRSLRIANLFIASASRFV
jgi:hypothetical protein